MHESSADRCLLADGAAAIAMKEPPDGGFEFSDSNGFGKIR
jgi:hypothetical protein